MPFLFGFQNAAANGSNQQVIERDFATKLLEGSVVSMVPKLFNPIENGRTPL
jgi:hypothetical protein